VSLLVVGSVALDTVETPFGRVTDVIGGSAVYFSASASVFHPVQLVGVVGSDYPIEQLDFLARRGVDLAGLERAEGESFRWSGFYDFDLNNAQTRGRRLGVGAEFRPHIPEPFRDAEWVFLASTDPDLQSEVLDQVRSPRLVACDTMDHWIESKRDALLRLLGRVDVLLINEAEIRRLSNEYNLVSAARWTQARGPEYVVVKKGEHGAMLFTSELVFFTPGYPLESIFDPTGAGDAFAGGFLGHLARAGEVTADELRRAMVFGSVMGSFVVERFGVDRLVGLTHEEIEERVVAFREMTAFEHRWPARAHV